MSKTIIVKLDCSIKRFIHFFATSIVKKNLSCNEDSNLRLSDFAPNSHALPRSCRELDDGQRINTHKQYAINVMLTVIKLESFK